MTVKELIVELKNYPSDAEVLALDSVCCGCSPYRLIPGDHSFNYCGEDNTLIIEGHKY